MANVDKNGYIKVEDKNGNFVTIYPHTKVGNVDGLDVFGASGGGHSIGLVPDPGSSSGSTKFLCENGKWAIPSSGGGDVSSIKMNNSAYLPDSSGVVNLGTVITEHQSLSGYVPTSRTINGYNLTSDRNLSYSDVGAASSSHTHNNYVKQAYYTTNMTSGSINSNSEGRVFCSSNVTGGPVSNVNMMVETIVDYNGSYKTQKAEVMSGTYAGHLYTRYYTGGSWSSWVDQTQPQLKTEELYFGLPSQTWTKSTAGMYYSDKKTATTLSEIYSATIDGWTGLKATDYVGVSISGMSSNQVSLFANVNVFSSGSWLKVKVVGI